MKKVFLWLFLIVVILLCIKSSLGFGKKETIIDIMNTNTSIKQDNKQDNEEDNMVDIQDDCYYTTVNPVEIQSYIINDKLSNNEIILLNENSSFKNETFLELRNNFDFDKNTYLLINCTSKKNIDCISKELTKSNLSFIIKY